MTNVLHMYTNKIHFAPERIQGPAWLSGEVYDSKLRPQVQAALDALGFLWKCPWARHFRAQS